MLSRQSPRSRASPDFGSLLAKIPELNDFHSSRVFFYKFSFPRSPVTDMKLNVVERAVMKKVLKKLGKTDIGMLLREYGAI